MQVVFHHVLPLAMPGILTGTIIGMAHALGETAPLLMIGMVAFIVDVPNGVTDAGDRAAGADLSVGGPARARLRRAHVAAPSSCCSLFLFVHERIAVYLRQRFERRW